MVKVKKSGSVISNERTIMVDGHEGREFSMIIHIKNHELIAHNRVVLHEKICYALVCAVPTKKQTKIF